MGRIFTVNPKYYDDNRKLYKHNKFEIDPGITILIGCNGSGKTTMLYEIAYQLKKAEVPYVIYDNLKDGGSHGIEQNFYHDNMDMVATMMSSSEGENIALNLGDAARKVGYMITHSEGNEKWILFDAIDSGLSIDQVREVKEYLLHMILEREKDKEIYIVVSANEYEMCVDEKCFNVVDGKYVDIKTYNGYQRQILNTRKYKDKWCQ